MTEGAANNGRWRFRELLGAGYHIFFMVIALVGFAVYQIRADDRRDARLDSIDSALMILDKYGTVALRERVNLLATQLNTVDQRESTIDKIVEDRLELMIKRMIQQEDAWRRLDVIDSKQEDLIHRLEILEKRVQEGGHQSSSGGGGERGPTGPSGYFPR